MDGIELTPDFKEFLRLLEKNGVEYMLVGGFAVGWHGHPRTTGDMDVWVGLAQENIRRLRHCLLRL